MTSMLQRTAPDPSATIGRGSVPSELHRLMLDAGLRGRQLIALSARFGLTGTRPTTLKVAGEAAGYTRERVRQLEEQLRTYAAENDRSLSATKGALRFAESRAPTSMRHLDSELERLGLADGSFPVGSLLRAAELLRLESAVFELGAAVFRQEDLGASDEALAQARSLVRRAGVGHIERLDAAAQTLLPFRPELIWVDDRRHWFLVRGTLSRAELLLRKMFSNCRSLTVRQVHGGFRRAPRPIHAPLQVVARLCETLPWLVVDRGTVTRKIALDPTHTHSPVEQVILGIFAEHGPVMRFAHVVDRGAALGLKRVSVAVYLSRMPSIVRVQRGLYAVRGGER